MASRGVGAEPWPYAGDGLAHHPYLDGGKRRVSQSEGSDYLEYEEARERKRFRAAVAIELDTQRVPEAPSAPTAPFLVLRESTSPLPDTPAARGTSEPTSCAMERTESGLSISSDSSIYTTFAYGDNELLDDDKAAERVEKHLAHYRRKAHRSRHERILRSLIQPRSRDAEFSIDNAALESIFSAANEIFFHGRLSRRVTWDWSHSSSAQYQNQIIGTTALRRSRLQKGFETLIVLSHPILNDKKYNRRLLISTFLHELIHSYLFICCGFKARYCGGHTAGFRRIAELIDQWAGADTLHLQNMEADLDDFKQHQEQEGEDGVRFRAVSAHREQGDAQTAHLPPGEYDFEKPYHPQHYHHHHYPHHQIHHHPYQQQQEERQYLSQHHYPTPPVERPVRHPHDGWNVFIADRDDIMARPDDGAPSTLPAFSQHDDTYQDAPEIVTRPVRWIITPGPPTTTAVETGSYYYQGSPHSLHHLDQRPAAYWTHHERGVLSQSPAHYPDTIGSTYVA